VATTTDPASRYDGVSQTLHWVTAVLVLYAFTNGPGKRELGAYLASRDAQRQLHETLGVCVFALVLVRLAWRRIEKRPPPLARPRWMTIAANVTQTSLYVLMVAVPITAIAGAWLEGHPVTLLAGVSIPTPMVSHALGVSISSLHAWLGDLIMWIAGFHAAAALFHHVVLRDAALISMLPRWLPLGARTRV